MTKYDPDKHHRRSIRLKGYDYTQAGAYFVTICAQNREYLFGEIVDDKVALNEAGCMVRAVWEAMPHLYNARPTWLDLAHQKLDRAVLDAYG